MKPAIRRSAALLLAVLVAACGGPASSPDGVAAPATAGAPSSIAPADAPAPVTAPADPSVDARWIAVA